MYAIRSYYVQLLIQFLDAVEHRPEDGIAVLQEPPPGFPALPLTWRLNAGAVVPMPTFPVVLMIKFLFTEKFRITSYNVCYTKLLRIAPVYRQSAVPGSDGHARYVPRIHAGFPDDRQCVA